MPKFIFLQYVDEARAPRPGTPELDAVIQAFATYLEELKAAGAFLDGDPCQPSAAAFTVQAHDGEPAITNGPLSSAVPWLNGYFVLDCKDRDAAAAWAAKNPAARAGSVEVHPILSL